ncbi:MAG: GGDEF domain-containing protein, partial [Pseudomonadota bacterium]
MTQMRKSVARLDIDANERSTPPPVEAAAPTEVSPDGTEAAQPGAETRQQKSNEPKGSGPAPQASGSADSTEAYDPALPPIHLRAVKLAKLFANVIDTRAALVDLGGAAGPVVVAPNAELADQIASAWTAPTDRRGTQTHAPDLSARSDSGAHSNAAADPSLAAIDWHVTLAAPVWVDGRKGWIAAIDDRPATPTPRQQAVADLVGELAADSQSVHRANKLWGDRLKAANIDIELVQSLLGAGTARYQLEGDCLQLCDVAHALLGLDTASTLDDFLDPFAPHDKLTLRKLLAGGQGHDTTTVEFDIDSADGPLKGIRLHIAFDTDEVGAVRGWFATIADVTSERAQLQDLRVNAERDALTGVYNQNQFDGALANAIADAQREREHVGLLLVSVDRYRDLNQVFGHEAGDIVTRFVARVLTNLVRNSDRVVRLGRNEFGVILARASDEDGVVQRAKSIQAALSTTVSTGEDRVRITASIGMAIFPQDTESNLDLYAAASYALGQMPEGPSVLHRYDATMRRRRDDERRFIEEIRRGLQHEEFTPFFQPKV